MTDAAERNRVDVKRVIDIAFSGLALIFLTPALIVIAAMVKVTSPGPIMYGGERVGRQGRRFRMFKFRSMVADAERLGGSATANDDPRITRLGLWLRRYKLDELPQLFNVLRGEMSLVGPRPEVRKYVEMYGRLERRILNVRPGITDWATIWNADEGAVLEGAPDPERAYEEFIRPTKVQLQLEYLRTRSVTGDLRILFHTAMRLLIPQWSPREIRHYRRAMDVRQAHAMISSKCGEPIIAADE